MSLSRLGKKSIYLSQHSTRKFFSTQVINKSLTAKFKQASIVPVLSIQDLNKTVPLVRALMQGGLNVVEIALRTPHALQAIELVRKNFSDNEVTVGAATVVTVDQFKNAIHAGAQFAASPLFNPKLLEFANNHNFSYLPCVFDTQQISLAAEAGFKLQKLFPMDQMGDQENGEKFLRAGSTQSILSALGGVQFCTSRLETHPSDVETYLKHSNVVAVASGWSAPEKSVAQGDWDTIRKLAKDDKVRANAVINLSLNTPTRKLV